MKSIMSKTLWKVVLFRLACFKPTRLTCRLLPSYIAKIGNPSILIQCSSSPHFEPHSELLAGVRLNLSGRHSAAGASVVTFD